MHGIKKRTIKLKLAGTALKSPGTAQKTGKKGTRRRVEVSRFYSISFPYLELLHTIVTFPYKLFCYMARFSLNKVSTVTGWFLVTCPWSKSNTSRSGYNCAVVVLTSNFAIPSIASTRKRTRAKHVFNVTSNVWVSGVKLWCFPAQMWSVVLNDFINCTLIFAQLLRKNYPAYVLSLISANRWK